MNKEDVIKEVIRNSGAAWFENYAKIYGKDRGAGVITPKCNYLQSKIQRVIDRFVDLNLPIRIIGLKPRQKGSTTFFSAQAYCFLRRNPASAVIIGGQFSQVNESWSMWQTYAKHDKFDWKNTGEVNAKTGVWSHGSKLIGESAKDVLAGVGGTFTVLHAFEVARWSKHGVANAGEVLTNILKAVPLIPNSMAILESTAEGDSGPFPTRYKAAVTAEQFLSGEAKVQAGSFVSIFAGWHEFSDSALRLTEEEKKRIRDTLDHEEEYSGEKALIEMYGHYDEDGVQHLGKSVTEFDVWEQLAWRRWSIREECERDKDRFDRDYPHSAAVAFQKSGNVRFNATGLAVQRKWIRSRPPAQYGIIEETKQGGVVFRPTEKQGAKVKIFEKPIPRRRYILALDPMTGATQTGGIDPDRHGAFVLREGYYDDKGAWRKAAVAARLVQCRWDVHVAEPEVFNLARMYGPRSGCMIVVETNKDTGFIVLLKNRGCNLYQRELFDQREQKTSKALGFSTTEKTREMLIETMANAIRNWDVDGGGIEINDEDALDQCDNFVRKENGRSEASEGWHDDDVLAISMGLTVIGHATPYFPQTPTAWYSPPQMGRAEPPRNPGAYS